MLVDKIRFLAENTMVGLYVEDWPEEPPGHKNPCLKMPKI